MWHITHITMLWMLCRAAISLQAIVAVGPGTVKVVVQALQLGPRKWKFRFYRLIGSAFRHLYRVLNPC